MIRPPPSVSRRARHEHAAFSLLEIILVVALLGLLVGLFISGASALARPREPRPQEQFWDALTAARQLALESGREVTFVFDRESRSFIWSNGGVTRSAVIAVNEVEFLPTTGESSVLLGGELVETGALPTVHLYPDGGCDPFRAQARGADGRRTIWQVDPWTCAPILPARP